MGYYDMFCFLYALYILVCVYVCVVRDVCSLHSLASNLTLSPSLPLPLPMCRLPPECVHDEAGGGTSPLPAAHQDPLSGGLPHR